MRVQQRIQRQVAFLLTWLKKRKDMATTLGSRLREKDSPKERYPGT